jgi:hypothetical protein
VVVQAKRSFLLRITMAGMRDERQQLEEQSTSSLVAEDGAMIYVSTNEQGERLRAILAWDGKIRPTEFVGGAWGDARMVAGVACPTFRIETDAGIRNGVLSLEHCFGMQDFRSRIAARLPKPMFDEMASRHATYMARRRFYPNGSSTSGFLGWDERLEAAIAEDEAVLQRLGVSHTEIGRRLKDIFDGYWRIFEPWHLSWRRGESTHPWTDPIDVDAFRVGRSYSLGSQECPFEGCEFSCIGSECAHSNCDFTISSSRDDSVISLPGISWHLIGDHKFFEGKAVPYRVEPEPLINLLFEKM